MQIYTQPVTCDICGGHGVARIADAASRWLGAELAHTDPRICRDNLKAKAEQQALSQTTEKKGLSEL